MKIAFQADNDIDQTIIKALWELEPEIDFQTASDANLHGLDDYTVLELAAFEKRLLISSDQTTMPYHFADFIQSNISYGVIIAPQGLSLNVVVNELLTIWECSEADEWIDRIAFIPL